MFSRFRRVIVIVIALGLLMVIATLVPISLASQPTTLNIVIRDPGYPCKPYSATGDDFWVGVFNCDSTLFTLQPLAGVGPGGGRIYGEIKVQPGAYTVVGFSLCKNVLTNWAVVIAGCGENVCVNLLPRKFWHCLAETDIAIKLAEKGITYPFGSEPR